VDLGAVAVELYGLVSEEFTAARNELAKTAGGRTAAAIRALRKPTLAAWLANLLVRSDPDGVNALTELGDALRAAHLSADGAALRSLTPSAMPWSSSWWRRPRLRPMSLAGRSRRPSRIAWPRPLTLR
jgi:hypothetical protein